MRESEHVSRWTNDLLCCCCCYFMLLLFWLWPAYKSSILICTTVYNMVDIHVFDMVRLLIAFSDANQQGDKARLLWAR